jgi:hypothetical protein
VTGSDGQQALTQAARDEADLYMLNGGETAMRTCWQCNSAHDHLRTSAYPFWCFSCGRWWFKGFDITDDGGSA